MVYKILHAPPKSNRVLGTFSFSEYDASPIREMEVSPTFIEMFVENDELMMKMPEDNEANYYEEEQWMY